MARPIGVVLMNLGGPEGPGSVRPFLRNLFSDPAILPVPLGRWLRPLLAEIISRAREAKSRAIYERIGGRSPLLDITRAQATGLERALGEGGGAWAVEIAMRYWHPLTGEAVARLAERGVDRAVALPLYPQYSRATTGSSLAELDRVVGARSGKKEKKEMKLARVGSWHGDPGYLDALAETVIEGLSRFAPERRGRSQVVFSAHSIPLSLVKAGDPYAGQVEETVRGVVRRVAEIEGRARLAYQSRVGPVRWLGPDTPSVIEEMGASKGSDGLLVVPVSFVAENVETLEEIDIRYRAVAERAGVREFHRAPAVNDRPSFIAALAALVRMAAAGLGEESN